MQSVITDAAPLSRYSAPHSPYWIARPRLFARLDELSAMPVIWLAAAAGCGKTVLAASYLAARKRSVLWYRIDERDSDPGVFFHSLREAARDCGLSSAENLPPLTGEYIGGETAYARNFIESLFKGAPTGFTLVLDDFQQLPEESPLHPLLPAILESVPSPHNVFVLSRHQPPPELARLRANRQLGLLNESELRLTQDEAKALAAAWPSSVLSSKATKLLHERLQGWAAGMVMTIEYLSRNTGSNLPAAAEGSIIFDYFATELLTGLDAQTRALLCVTALPAQFDTQLAQRLSGNSKAESLLHTLLHRNFFIYQEGGSFRYHPLFRDFLLRTARREWSAEQLTQLQVKAAELLLERREPDLALPLLRTAGNWQRFSSVLLELAPAMMAQGRHRELTKHLLTLPDGLRQESPWPDFWLAAALLPNDRTASYAAFSAVYDRFRADHNRQGALLAWLGAVDAVILSLSDARRLDTWLEHYERLAADNWLPPEDHPLSGQLTSRLLIISILRRPDHPGLTRWRQGAYKLLSQLADLNQRTMVTSYLMLDCISRGRLGEAASLAAGTVLTDGLLPPLAAIASRAAHTWLAWATGQHEECIASCRETLAAADHTGINIWSVVLLMHGLASSLVRGDMAMAERMAAEARERLPAGSQMDQAYYHNEIAWLCFVQGDPVRALEYQRVALRLTEDFGAIYSLGEVYFGMAQIQHELGDLDEARNYLDKVREISARSGSWSLEFRVGLTAAHFAWTAGQEARCIEILRAVLEKARRNGILAFDWWRRDIVARLCAIALTHDIERELAYAMIRRFQLPPPSDVDTSNWPWPVRIRTLGRFELEVTGKPVELSGNRYRRPCDLLKLLLASGPHGAAEIALAETLWPDLDGDAAIRNLRTNLHRLRRLLGSEAAVEVVQGRLSINPTICWTDVAEFTRLLDCLSSCSDVELSRTVERLLALNLELFLPDEEGTAITHYRAVLARRAATTLASTVDRLRESGYDQLAEELSLRSAALAATESAVPDAPL